MKKLCLLFLALLLSVFLASCTNVQRRDNKVQKELDDRGWTCSETKTSFKCELAIGFETKTVYSDSLHFLWTYQDEDILFYGMTIINLHSGEFTHEVDSNNETVDRILYRVNGNVFSGDVICNTNDETLEYSFFERVDSTYNYYLEIIEAAGFSIRNYNQSGFGHEIQLPDDLEGLCDIVTLEE